jgi:hypothetical protein
MVVKYLVTQALKAIVKKSPRGVPRGGITGSGVPKGHYLTEVPKDRPRTRWGGGDPHSRKYELKKIRKK